MKKSIFTLLIVIIISLTATSCMELRDVNSIPDETADGSAGDTTDEIEASATITKPDDTSPLLKDGHSYDTETAPSELNSGDKKFTGVTKKISFLAAGDNVIHPCIYLEAKKRATDDTREYNFKPMYADVIEFIEGYDLSFINQETLMCGSELGYTGYPRFNSPQDLGYDLFEMGFDIINIANNHMVDQWENGLKKTIEFWRNQPVTLIGDALSQDEYESFDIIEKDGITIALLSYTYGTNGLSLPSSSELVVPYINDADIQRHVSNAKEDADLVFVSVHWGDENTFKPTSEQKRVAQLMADAGVDVIIGHHPHVIQPIEWLEGTNGEKTLCIYSLGNLVSAMMYCENMVGGFVTFDIIQVDDNKPYIDNVQYVPTVFFYGMNYYSTHLYFMQDYTEEMAKKHGTQIYGNYASIAKMRKYVTDNISAEYLPDWLKQ